MIPILDLKRQIAPIRSELDAAIKKVVDEADFVFGREIDEFEKNVTTYSNAQYAVGVSNGTDAIKLALIALGIQPGDGVLCPAFTYYATAGAIASMGARPVFTDIEPDTYTMSIESIEKVLKQNKKHKISAMVPVHLYGQCVDMDAILKISKKYKLKVVEDTAQAFGAEYKLRKAGTFGHCGAVSLFPGKNLGAFGDAGIILTNKKTVAERLKLLRNQGNRVKYRHEVIGYNHRMDTIQAAVLKVKLKYYESWNAKRRDIAAFYNQELKNLAQVKTPFVSAENIHIYHQYVVRLTASSQKMMEYLRGKNIDSRVYYPIPLHLQKCFKYLGYKKGDFPESEKACAHTLAIPVYPDLTQEEKIHIVSSIRGYLQ